MRARDIRAQRKEAEEAKYIGFAPVDEEDDGEPWDEPEQESDDELPAPAMP